MGKKKLTITLYMSELVYDFQNKAFLTGRSRKTDANAEQASNMQASDDEEDMNQTLRSIQGAYGTLLSVLSDGLYGGFVEDGGEAASTAKPSYASLSLSTPSGETADNGLQDASTDLVLTLRVPSNFVMALKDTIASCLHDYVVNTALCDWFEITNKADAADYGAKAQAALVVLRQTLCRRERPTRKGVGA